MALSAAELAHLAQQAYAAGRWRRAEDLLTKLLGLETAPQTLFLLGVCRHQQGRLGEALQAFEQVVAIDPGHQEACFAAIAVSCAAGNLGYARQLCDLALERFPGAAQVHSTAGTVLELLGEKEGALSHYDRALQLNPTAHDALLNRGALLLEMRRFSEARINNIRLAEFFPSRWTSHFNLGEALAACDEFEAAADAYAQARVLFPAAGKALLQEAYVRTRLREIDHAQALLSEAWRSHQGPVQAEWQRFFPGAPKLLRAIDARALSALLAYDAVEQCDWRGYDEFILEFSSLLEQPGCLTEYPLAFRALALGIAPRLQLNLARAIAADVEKTVSPQRFDSGGRLRAECPIRVGYLSANFGQHAVGLTAHRLFDLHDRESFAVYAYAIGPAYDDDIRESIELAADQFADLAAFDDDAAARAIAADEIDILIDLCGYNDFARPGILARRPAPVQLAGIAYLASSGAPWMDYLLLDSTTASDEVERSCSERLIRMPNSMFPFTGMDVDCRLFTRAAAGLPETAVVLAAFHDAYKIHPDIFDIWMRLLVKYPDTILWLLQGSDAYQGNLRREAEARGIAPERLVFAPRLPHAEHLARLSLADLFLDTAACNGGAEVCDAVVAGVPVLTCAGVSIAQRVAASILRAADFGQGVTCSLPEYEAKAELWLSDNSMLPALRSELHAAKTSAPIFQFEKWVGDFERALLHVHQRHLQGLPPESFSVSECLRS